MQEKGIAVIGQTGSLAPADKTLYALRDVTATVDSMPLIASSIMSKKLASGSDAIVLDVKTGSGAIMQTLEDSIKLAETLVSIGTLAGKPVTAIVTDMAQPLGTHVGNALEVKEAIEVLSGEVKGDLLEVALLLGSQMLLLAGKAQTQAEAHDLLTDALESGRGLDKLRDMITAQGGDPRVCDDVNLLPQPAVKKTITCGATGYTAQMDTTALGLTAQAMGAGRRLKTDVIDYSVGFILHTRIGDAVTPDTPLATLYARNDAEAEIAEAALRRAIVFSDQPVQRVPLCHAIITKDGVQRM